MPVGMASLKVLRTHGRGRVQPGDDMPGSVLGLGLKQVIESSLPGRVGDRNSRLIQSHKRLSCGVCITSAAVEGTPTAIGFLRGF